MLKTVRFPPDEAEVLAGSSDSMINGLRSLIASKKPPLASQWNEVQRLLEEYDRDGFWQRVYRFDGRVKETLATFVSEGRRVVEVIDELGAILLEMRDAVQKSTNPRNS
jgi:hypothetical protein